MKDLTHFRLGVGLTQQFFACTHPFLHSCVRAKLLQSCQTLCNPMNCSLPGSSVRGILQARIREWVAMTSSRPEYWSGSSSLLQGIFPTQGSNPGLRHCRQILYHLSHQKSPRILEWVAYSFSRGSSQPRNQTRVSCSCLHLPPTKRRKKCFLIF